MRDINKIIVHCSDTPDDRDVTATDIRAWHLDRGWRDIGYHYVIRRSGAVELGRPLEDAGAHVRGHNKDSIGVCLVGREDFSDEQWRTLRILVNGLYREFGAPVFGHNDFTASKTCPNFNVGSDPRMTPPNYLS